MENTMVLIATGGNVAKKAQHKLNVIRFDQIGSIDVEIISHNEYKVTIEFLSGSGTVFSLNSDRYRLDTDAFVIWFYAVLPKLVADKKYFTLASLVKAYEEFADSLRKDEKEEKNELVETAVSRTMEKVEGEVCPEGLISTIYATVEEVIVENISEETDTNSNEVGKIKKILSQHYDKTNLLHDARRRLYDVYGTCLSNPRLTKYLIDWVRRKAEADNLSLYDALKEVFNEIDNLRSTHHASFLEKYKNTPREVEELYNNLSAEELSQFRATVHNRLDVLKKVDTQET